ncbi:hypothetical protein [Pseudoduganella sp. GCM10020061]|uniref:hypothetical protein n=1 Tax=Pseudoduganella sp. GCM10020061 TaxID=3317345 RepID=UPI00362E5002
MPGRRLLSTFALAFAATVESGALAGTLRSAPRLCERIALDATARPSPDPLSRAVTDLAHRLIRFDRQVEHGAVFYRARDGTIRTGEIAVGASDTVDIVVSAYDGETIAGVLHTHASYPYYLGDQARLSREDIELGTLLLALPGTERGLRLYIVDVRARTLSAYSARC